MIRIYDKEGNLISTERWIELFHDSSYQMVRLTAIDGEVYVSTVWLGIDHNFWGSPPLIFETMVFGGDFDEWGWRHHTELEASNSHDQIVAALKEGRDLGELEIGRDFENLLGE